MRVQHIQVPLSKLRPGRKNPRRGKPRVEAHQQMVASIRAFNLLESLIVRPIPDGDGEYQVIAGNRRLAALRQIHRQDDPKIPCILRDVDDSTAEALALTENFIREDMHPLDEAESFARLAADEAKGPDGIAAMFGVTERYVRQRMKLAGLAKVVKTAFRQDEIDIGTAEVFASIPDDHQTAVWAELNGHPRHAEHVRKVIHHEWIDAKHALFDLSTLPEWKVSQDLFAERVLVERDVFLAAQAEALDKEKALLLEDGWREVVVGKYEEINDLTRSMATPEREFDPDTGKKLAQLAKRRQTWEAKLEELEADDEQRAAVIESKVEALDAQAQEIVQNAPLVHSDTTKAMATVFLMLLPDGQVRRDYRVPRTALRSSGRTNGMASDGGPVPQPGPPTSEDLNERQLADVFTHQALAVRQALLKAPAVRKRVLALILHEKVRSEALAVRHEANAVTLHAVQDGFKSEPFQQLREKRNAVDPFADDHSVDEAAAFEKLGEMPADRLNQLIDVLVVDCLTAHLQRRTGLVQRLTVDLKVDLRKTWRPDAAWLAGYQKIQLSHLLAELKGPVYSATHEGRKKSELIDATAILFADAAEGRLDNPTLADRVNAWLPPILRPMDATTGGFEKEEK